MELRHLRYFVAVAEELNFRRAAERVRVAQPALSKQIKDLEYDVGVKLLERSTAGVALTDAGTVFLESSRALLEGADRAVRTAREAAEGRCGRLVVGNVNAICASFMPAALSTFYGRFPEVDVDLRELLLPAQTVALTRGEIQVGFVVGDLGAEEAQFERFKVLEGEIQVAVGRGHRLAARRSVSLADLAEERVLCIEVGGHDLHRQRIRDIYAQRGVKPGRFKQVNSYESLQAMIEGDQGVSFLAAMPAKETWRNIIYRPLQERGEDLRFELHAVWRKQGHSQLAANFVAVLREVCGERLRKRKSA